MCVCVCVCVCPYALCAPHPRGYGRDGLDMEVRSNFKAKVRCARDNDEHNDRYRHPTRPRT